MGRSNCKDGRASPAARGAPHMQSRNVILGLALLNFACWTLMPTFFESGLRVDVAEAAAFGPEFLLSYPKHPPLSFWLTALVAKLGPFRTIAIHALGAGFATFAFYYIADYCRRTMSDRIGVLAMGVAGALGQGLLTLAYQRGHALTVSLLGYSQVVFTTLLGIVLWQDHPGLATWLGIALIVGSGALSTTFMGRVNVGKPLAK